MPAAFRLHRIGLSASGACVSLLAAACAGIAAPVAAPVAAPLEPATPAASVAQRAHPPSSRPLIQADDLQYVGAFRFPALPYTGQVCDGFGYGGRGLTFNPAGNEGKGSLLAAGHTYCGKVGEFGIPEARNSPSIEGLPHAPLLQVKERPRIVDALEGGLAKSGIKGGTHSTVNGLLVWRNRLVVSAGNAYTYSQPVSHWSRPLDLSSSGQVTGPITVVGDRGYSAARFTAGYMCHIPADLQAALGGPAITGWVADSIVSATSDGPAAFAFDPGAVASGKDVPARTLLFYPHTKPLEASVPGARQAVWNWTSMPRGCALPDGTRTLLYIGRHGSGEFQYGVGGANGHTNTQPRVPIHDPSDTSTGEHAWPYRYQVWAYDANDLARVRQGAVQPWQVKPYAVWSLRLPYVHESAGHGLEGIAYDPLSRRLFVVQEGAGKYGEPVIQVFSVRNAAPTKVSY
jgi:hypothetical protein